MFFLSYVSCEVFVKADHLETLLVMRVQLQSNTSEFRVSCQTATFFIYFFVFSIHNIGYWIFSFLIYNHMELSKYNISVSIKYI